MYTGQNQNWHTKMGHMSSQIQIHNLEVTGKTAIETRITFFVGETWQQEDTQKCYIL